MTPRAITAMGVVTPLGTGRRAFFESVRRGRRGARRHGPGGAVDLARYPGACVTEVDGFDPVQLLGDKGLRPLDRLSKLVIAATRLALDDLGLKRDGRWSAADPPWADRVGLVVSNAYGSLEAIHELDRVALLEDARYINPSRFPLTVSNSAAGYASIWEEVRAVNVTVSDGNCGALDAVQCADLLLESRRADVLLVGGAEALCEPLVVAFRRLGLGSPRESFAGDSPVLGEGAALFAIEADPHARARGVEPIAHVVGYGTAFEAPERAASLVHASDRALQRASQAALVDAAVGPSEVDLVVSGLSGLPAFDGAEIAAIDRVFGMDAPVIAPKRAVGETLGASAAMAIAVALVYLVGPADGEDGEGVRGEKDGRVAGERRVDAAGPGYLVRGTVRGPVRTVLVTSLGYYGNASALVIRRSSR